MKKLRLWCQFLRIDNAPLSIGAPVIGALAQNAVLPFWQILVLGVIGFCAHVYGFVLNDVADMELDSKNPVHQGKPLLNGFMTRRSALLVACGQVPLSLVLGTALPHSSFLSAALLLGSVGLAGLYNLYGKKFRTWTIAADAALGASVGLMVVWGALVTGGTASSLPISLGVYLCLQVALVNMLMSLKDLQYDLMFGAHTSAIWLRVRLDAQGRPVMSKAMRCYSLILEIASTLLLGGTFLSRLWGYSDEVISALEFVWLLMGGFALLALVRFLWVASSQRYAQVNFDLGCAILLVALGARVGAQSMFYLLGLMVVPLLIAYPVNIWARHGARRSTPRQDV